MAFELQTAIELNRDRILKKQLDQLIKGRLQILAGQFSAQKRRTKVNLVFLLDSSGSMDGPYYATGKTKRQAVYEAVQSLIELFDKSDTISIISFNTLAVPHTDHIPGSFQTAIKEAMDKYLKDSGGTNFEVAMKMANSVCKKNTGENYKIIFLTDGNSESGNNANALKICQELSDRGVTTDAMGIGGDFDFNYMKKFSDLSGSKTENITQPSQATQVFRDIHACSSNVFLKKVFINLHFSKQIRDVHFYMHEPEQKNLHDFIYRDKNGTTVQVNAGDIEQQAFKEFLFDFTIDTSEESSIEIARMLINFDCPSENIVNRAVEQVLHLNLADSGDAEIVDGSIETAYRDIEILERQNDFFKLVAQKNFTQAATCLETMAGIAERIGDHDKARHFREKKNELMRNNNITQEDLNAIAVSSSRSSAKSRLQIANQSQKPLV